MTVGLEDPFGAAMYAKKIESGSWKFACWSLGVEYQTLNSRQIANKNQPSTLRPQLKLKLNDY
jgi:hypothetical protein